MGYKSRLFLDCMKWSTRAIIENHRLDQRLPWWSALLNLVLEFKKNVPLIFCPRSTQTPISPEKKKGGHKGETGGAGWSEEVELMRWRVNQLEKDKLEVTSRHNQEVRHRERFCPTESLKPQQHKALWVVCVCVRCVCWRRSWLAWGHWWSEVKLRGRSFSIS